MPYFDGYAIIISKHKFFYLIVYHFVAFVKIYALQFIHLKQGFCTELRQTALTPAVIHKGALRKSVNPPTLFHEMLYDLFVAQQDADEKMKLLNQRYGVRTESLKEDVNTMCNLSELVEERGYKSGRKEGRTEIVQVIHRLQAGESPESIIAGGIEEHTVRLAQTCIK